MLKQKSDYENCFKIYCNRVQNQFNKNIVFIHSDNGGEYTSNAIRKFCQSLGIQQKFTVVDTPQQNGVAERMNLTLANMMRCMLQDSGLHQKYWGEAIEYAAYIRNHCPTSAVEDHVPYELWHGKKPWVSHLQPFGSIGYATIQKKRRSKLDNRAIKCILLGIENHTEGYRLLLPNTNSEVLISRDVTFAPMVNQQKKIFKKRK